MIQYAIGTSSWTREFPKEEFLEPLNKQFHISIPLITGVNIKRKGEDGFSQKIYVGKEINLKEYSKEQYLRNKFNIPIADLADIAVKGFERACLLNYKKYDQILIGIEEDALVVPDYFALKTSLEQCMKNAE